MEWFCSEAPDILCIQETKADKESLPGELLNMPGYHIIISSAQKKGYSGVLTYSKPQPLDAQLGFGIEKFDNEGRIAITTYEQFVLLNIYFPNGKQSPERLQYKMEFYEAFLNYVDTLKNEGKGIVICGDVNTAHKEIDIARPKENSKVSGFLPEERAWIDKFISHGYIDTFRMFNQESGQYTWWDLVTRARERNVGWRIDYFYVSENLQAHVKDAWILPDVMGSDHCPIGLKLEF